MEESRGAGRPTKYREEYCDLIVEYFNKPHLTLSHEQVATAGKVVELSEEKASELPTFADFAIEIGVCIDTLNEWTRVHPRFSESYKKAKSLQENHIIKNAYAGRVNTIFSLFMLKCNHGWREETKEEVQAKSSLFTITPYKKENDSDSSV